MKIFENHGMQRAMGAVFGDLQLYQCEELDNVQAVISKMKRMVQKVNQSHQEDSSSTSSDHQSMFRKSNIFRKSLCISGLILGTLAVMHWRRSR